MRVNFTVLFICAFSMNAVMYKAAAAAGFRSLDITTAAFIIAGVLLSPALVFVKRVSVSRADLFRLLAAVAYVILVGGSVGFLALAEGVGRSGAARGGLFLMTVPVMTALFDAVLGTRYEKHVLVSGGLTIIGGIVLAAPGFAHGGPGDLFLGVMVIAFASANVAARIVMRFLPPMLLGAIRALGGGICLLLIGGAPWNAGIWGMISGALASMFLPSICVLISRVGPAKASLANIYASFLAMMMGIVLFDERLTLIQWTGAGIIISVSLVEGWRKNSISAPVL